jgi:hypothetical protein
MSEQHLMACKYRQEQVPTEIYVLSVQDIQVWVEISPFKLLNIFKEHSMDSLCSHNTALATLNFEGTSHFGYEVIGSYAAWCLHVC